MRAEPATASALAAIACAIALSLALTGCSPPSREAPGGTPETRPIPIAGLEEAEIVRVVDGDTLSVRVVDGSEEKVRLIGVDAPESKSPDEAENRPEGEQAQAHLEEALPKGTRVWLSKDTSERDRYGRLFRYVWLDEPAGDAASPQEFCSKPKLPSVFTTYGKPAKPSPRTP